MKYKLSNKLFNLINTTILIAVGLIMLLPFVHIIAKSFSREVYVLSREVYLLPKGFTTGAYEYIFQTSQFLVSLGNSLFITIVGTGMSMVITSITAYPLVVGGKKFSKMLMPLYLFTMYFSGGIIPTYLVVKNLNLTNTLWSLIIPCLVIPFNLIMIKNFFASIPFSLFESARMDGASHTKILFRIYVPLSKAGFATIMMFYAVGYWNNFFSAMMYITKRELIPLQFYLRQMIIDSSNITEVGIEALMQVSPESVRAATIIAATLPIVIVYPFVQKHFVKGATLGAVKG